VSVLSVWLWAWAGDFVLGLVATALTRIRWPKNGVWMAGIGVFVGFGLGILDDRLYPNSFSGLPPLFGVVGYGIWLVSVGAGVGVVYLSRRQRPRPPETRTPN
jgi:hypothetical protein